MKSKKFLSLTFILLLFFLNPILFSQISFQVGVGGGMTFPQADYGGSTIDFYNGTKYGLSNGYNLHAKARLGLLGFNLFAQIDYQQLKNNGESEPGKGKVDIMQKIISAKAGPEVYLSIPLSPIKPYLGMNISFNNFSGEFTFTGVAKVPSGTYEIKSAARIGIGFSGGVMIKLGLATSLDLAVHYDLLNLTGKAWEDVEPNKDQRIDSYLALNDEKDPNLVNVNDDHFISKQRTINTLQVTLTFMLGL
ncbi:MAG: outer membrane beta-barrel protein [Ignavibacteria bacterium]|nr:outer membrane beta-barrel protein [Ignavibacteria bacterium]